MRPFQTENIVKIIKLTMLRSATVFQDFDTLAAILDASLNAHVVPQI